jgi:hypothetical protein
MKDAPSWSWLFCCLVDLIGRRIEVFMFAVVLEEGRWFTLK